MARFVPGAAECESGDHSLCSTPYLGSSLAFVESDVEGLGPTCLVGAPGFLRWGFVPFVDDLDWERRQLMQESEDFHAPRRR